MRPAGPSGWGPDGRRAAIALTFDNLGEAADLERGRRPAGAPLGEHFSVTRVLPRLLGLLSEPGVRATFFVEGWSAAAYPQAPAAIAAAGHEVALHGWRHERWSDLDAERERALLGRGVEALGALGLAPRGFRPPGGVLGPASWRALPGAGLSYCSPAGEGAAVRGNLAVLPFRWSLIDAFHYLPDFAPRRLARLGGADVLSPNTLRATLATALTEVAGRGGFLALLFHPFLLDDEERLDVLRGVVDQLAALAGAGAVWSAPLAEIAAWMERRPQAGGWALQLDLD